MNLHTIQLTQWEQFRQWMSNTRFKNFTWVFIDPERPTLKFRYKQPGTGQWQTLNRDSTNDYIREWKQKTQ